MIDLSKKTLFFLILLNAVLGGITSHFMNWEVFETGKGILKEIQLPLIFLTLSFVFMFKYIKKIKEEKKIK
tara:strand:- start:363 stop:575 length:213 start_codon:yes stop_codon:yes gene_type:complete